MGRLERDLVSGMPFLSVIVPVYNEEKTIAKIVSLIDSVKIDKEIIAVDDASRDKSREILEGLNLPCLRVISHRRNMGKGASFRTGLKNAQGEVVIIRDADLEYNPQDYLKLIPPILNNQADMVLGPDLPRDIRVCACINWVIGFSLPCIIFCLGAG